MKSETLKPRPTKELESEINRQFLEDFTKRRKDLTNAHRQSQGLYNDIWGYGVRAFMPLTNYKLKRLPNNRPLTLLSEKENHKADFVAFVNIKTYLYNGIVCTRKAFFDIDEQKRTTSAGDRVPTQYPYKDARKDEGEIYILLNKDIKTFNEKVKKHIKRQEETRETLTGWERYSTPNPTNAYYFRACIDKKYNNNSYSGYYFYKEGDLDKSGYLLRYVREELQQRAKKLKREREQAKREAQQRAWEESDHTQQAEEINALLNEIGGEMVKRSTLESLSNRAIFRELEQYRKIYNSFIDLLQFNNYSCERWEKEKANLLQEYNFYKLAITRGVFDRLACFHHYEKTETGYKMKANTDAFWQDASRYIQEF